MESKKIIPIFVLGTEHSGTSILYKMLGMHPDLAWFSQFSRRGGDVPNRFRIPFYKYFNLTLRSLFLHNWHKKGGKIRIIPYPSEAHQIWTYIIPQNKDISPEESINLVRDYRGGEERQGEQISNGVKRIRRILAAECEDWHRSFIICKLLWLSEYMPLLRTAYPEAKFLHIVRDGRAVALSIRHKFMNDGQSAIEGLKAAAQYWVEKVGKINKEKAEILEVRYEDFCGDVHGHIRKALNFIGLDVLKFPFSRCPKTLTSANPKWLKSATDDEIALIEQIEKEYLKIYRYL